MDVQTPNHSVLSQPNMPDLGWTKAASSLVFAAEALERLAAAKQFSSGSPAPRRGLCRSEAAGYVGISPSAFDNLIKLGTMPKPVRFGSRTVWDLRALDDAFDELTTLSDQNPWSD